MGFAHHQPAIGVEQVLQTRVLGRGRFSGSLVIQQLVHHRLFNWIHRRARFSPERSIVKTGQPGQFSHFCRRNIIERGQRARDTVRKKGLQWLLGRFGYLTSRAIEWLRKFESNSLRGHHFPTVGVTPIYPVLTSF